jgi:hypothetical protein
LRWIRLAALDGVADRDDVTEEGAEVLSLNLFNRGVGTAHEQSLRVKVATAQQQMIFRVPGTAENARSWDLLAKEQGRWDVEFCYCLVFQECWQVPGHWRKPEPVKQCHRDESREFMP